MGKYLVFLMLYGSLLVAGAAEADDENYNRMTLDMAKQQTFPTASRWQYLSVVLNDDQKDAIAEASGLRVRFSTIPVWVAYDASNALLGVLMIDKVIGKHEFITYSLGVLPTARATQPFILDYRESYGQQVEGEVWRNQFVGKSRHDLLKVGKDIDNITGATLSCVNITNGVRRLLISYEQVIQDKVK